MHVIVFEINMAASIKNDKKKQTGFEKLGKVKMSTRSRAASSMF